MKKIMMVMVMVMAMTMALSMTACASVEKIETIDEAIETETIIDGTAEEAEQTEHKAWYKAAADSVCGVGKAIGSGVTTVGSAIGNGAVKAGTAVKNGVGTAFVVIGNFEVKIGNWMIKK